MDSLLFVTISVGVAVGALAIYIGNGVIRAQRSNSGARLAQLSSREETLQKDFSQRAIAPVMQSLGGVVLRFTPTGWVTRAQKKIVWAGWTERMDGNTWAAIRLIAAGAGVVGAFFLVPLVEGTMLKFAVGALVLFMGFFGPDGDGDQYSARGWRKPCRGSPDHL